MPLPSLQVFSRPRRVEAVFGAGPEGEHLALATPQPTQLGLAAQVASMPEQCKDSPAPPNVPGSRSAGTGTGTGAPRHNLQQQHAATRIEEQGYSVAVKGGPRGRQSALARAGSAGARCSGHTRRAEHGAAQYTVVAKCVVSDLPCNVRREGGQSLVIEGSSLVMLEGKACNPL